MRPRSGLQVSIERIPVFWSHEGSEASRGNFTGYSQANIRLKAALEPYFDFDPCAAINVAFTSPDYNHRTEGRFHVLFSMLEKEEHVEEYRTGLENCDLLVTCSRFCEDIFRRHIPRPVAYCPLGVNVQEFTRKRRRWDKRFEKFRWLYVGAASARKLTIVPGLYECFLSRLPNVELYLKTQGNLIGTEMEALLKGGVVEELEPGVYVGHNAVLDTRFLPVDELVKLMHSAHGGLLMTSGEGFALSGLEMMATGLPVVISDHSGVKDYSNHRNSYPVRCEEQTISVFSTTEAGEENGPPMDVRMWVPSAVDAMRQMGEVMMDYGKASRVGMEAAATARLFSWPQAAKRLHSILLPVWYSLRSGSPVELAS